MFFSQRGVMSLAHSVSDLRAKARNYHANKINDIDSEWLTPEQVKEIAPIVNINPDVRYPVLGATFQPRGGIAKHDWVAWGYAKAAADMGVDIIQGCEVTGFDIRDGKVHGVKTNLGPIAAQKVGMVAAGHSSVLANLAGFDIPIQSRPLQALVSELLEQVHNTVIMSGMVHVYVSQAHKGELVMGAGTDAFNSYAQRGGFHVIEHQLAAAIELFPIFERAHLLRTWGGIVDISPDASPIIGHTPVENLFINTGWGTGGFKATPASGWTMAHTIATGEPHELNAPFSLNRFVTGHLIDEHGAAGVAH